MPERRRYERTPDTLAVLAALAAAGTVITVAGNVPASVAAIAPTWVGLLWSGTFAAAAGVALLGVLLRDPVMGWSIELVGRAALCVTALAYVWVLASAARTLGPAIVVALLAAIGTSSGVRVWQITARLRAYLLQYQRVARRLGLHRGGGGRR